MKSLAENVLHMVRTINDFLFKLLLFTAACFLLHYLLEQYFFEAINFYIPLWQIYLFLTPLTLLGYLAILYIHQKDTSKTGIAFIAIGFIKMLAAVLFLYPLIASAYNNLLVQVISFFIPYFLYLGFDTYFTIRLISGK